MSYPNNSKIYKFKNLCSSKHLQRQNSEGVLDS